MSVDPELVSKIQAASAKASAALGTADALLICTGAGMGVDSGLGTFRGRYAGVWPQLKAMRMDFSEMSQPVFFDCDPRLAWAFWKFRHDAYTLGKPHDGYRLLSQWGQMMRYGCFSVTSNIDGHWERTEGIGEKKLYECHGALTRMQCVDDHGSIWATDPEGKIWRTDPEEIAKIAVPEWDLSPGEQVIVRYSGGEAEAVVQEDGCSLEVTYWGLVGLGNIILI